MCHKFNAYNGLPKTWKVIRKLTTRGLENLSFDDDRWETVTKVYTEENNPNPIKMPDLQGRYNYANEDPKYVPRTAYFQRNGKLIISHVCLY